MFTLVDGIRDVVVLEHRSSVTRDFAADLAGRSDDAALLLPNSFQSGLTVCGRDSRALGIQDRPPRPAPDVCDRAPDECTRRPTIST